MSTPHNKAALGDIAKTVLMPGDPLRAKFIAETYLENPVCFNTVRNMLGFTGTYKGKKITVMGSGMGMPSIGIYSYELYEFFGVENIIRIGSAGSYTERLEVMDIALAESAYSDSTFALTTSGSTDNIFFPSAELNEIILKKASELNITCKSAKVHSSDAFYTTPAVGSWKEISDRTNTECVEMESFRLFHNAKMLGKRATCLVTISDSFCSNLALTPEERQNSFTQMMTLALESAIEF